jgi:glyoxylase-like metal-dependent hydrolase (beta-lactamase superfamily II)
MQIHPFYEPDSGTWTYLVADPETRASVVIDPVLVYDPVSGKTKPDFIQQLLLTAADRNYRIEWVLETHAHADHVTAADYLRQKTGARLACGSGIRDVQRNFHRVFNQAETPIDGSQWDRLLNDGDTIAVGKLEIRVMDTPGHTSDSVTYLVGDAAFIGDTLFAPAFGTARCDFPGGDAEQLFDSIMALYELPGETRLFLCHDYPKDGKKPVCQVTVEQSRQDNIHIGAETNREDYVRMRRERDAGLSLPRLILPSLQLNIRAGEPPAPDDNGVVYLKTPLDREIEELIRD